MSSKMVDTNSKSENKHRKSIGFVAGIFSGMSKLLVGHPFDTIKVRMQTSQSTKFKSSLDCFVKTIKNEGVRALYKGASPPLVGWMMMDSLMLGSLHNYRILLKDTVYSSHKQLPLLGNCFAGMFGGWTVSLLATPVENIKARLQVQYDASTKKYSGPINCAKILYKEKGIKGLYKGFSATVLFRSFFFFYWGTCHLMTNMLKDKTNLSLPMINFISGGTSAQVFWILAYPCDVVKQKIMTDSITNPKYPTWRSAAFSVYNSAGLKGFTRGFFPCFLRAFPANAAALASFEAVMRYLS